MADISKSFLVENGLSFDNNVTLFSGSTDPSIVGEAAPIGSLFFRDNGQLWQKFSAANTDWHRITADAQPQHPNLTALSNASAGASPVGLYAVTGSGLSALRELLGTANQITVVNGNGVVSNPTISISDNPVLPGTRGFVVPKGTQSQETLITDGVIRYDITLGRFRFRQDGQWRNLGDDLLLYSENSFSATQPFADGQNSIAVGDGAVATGQNAVAIGSSHASSPQSTAIGNGARTSSYGQVAFSARAASSQGSSQASEYIYSGQTITQFPIEIFLDGVSQRASFPQPFTAVTFTALVIAQRVDEHGELFSCKIDGQLFKALVNNTTKITTVKSQWGATYQDMDCIIEADAINGTFNVKVRGKAGQTWRWVVRVSAVECVL